MRVVNILFNYKKTHHDNKVLGVERCFIDYSKHLIAHGDKVVAVSKPGMVYRDQVKQVGARLLELPAFGQADIFSIFGLAFLFLTFRADVVLCHSGKALFLARAARVAFYPFLRKLPIVGVNHGVRTTKFLKADYVLNVNSHFHKEMIKFDMKEHQSIIFPNMMEVPRNFCKLVKPLFRNPIKLGSLGRLYPEKYFDKVVKAVAVLKEKGIECDYVIGGVGPEEQRLNQLAKELGVEKNFKILGWVESKKEFFEAIDIFVLPSFEETFGIVLLEAMLYSTPIVTSNSWGPDGIITNDVDGIKVSKDDDLVMPSLIADAIVRLNSDQELAKKFAENAYQKFITNYSAEVLGKRLHDTLEKIVNG